MMASLEFCSKYNMVAYLEKTDGNTEFHQFMDFLIRSSIYYALTISLMVSTSFVEQFWTTAKSRTVNNISYIDATVAGKPVTISKASIRSDLLFDDADGIDLLNNQAIFDNIQLMGYEGDLNTLTFNKALFSPQWKFLFHTMNHCISSKSTSWDQIPTNIATARVFGGNHGGQSSSDRSLSGNEDGLTLQSVYDLCISFCTQWMQKESVSKQGRKPAKAEPTVHKDPAFNDLDDDAMDYIETEDDQDEERISFVVLEEKESADKEVSTEAPRTIEGLHQTKIVLTLKSFKIDQKIKSKRSMMKKMVAIKGKKREWEAKAERKGLLEKKLLRLLSLIEYAFIQDRIKCNKVLARSFKWKRKSRSLPLEQREKFLLDTIVAQRTFLAQQRQIKELNKDPKKKRVIKETPREEDTTKVPAEQEVTEQGTKKRKSGHVKMLARKRPRPQPDDGSDDEHRKCLRIITFKSTIDSEIMETKSFIARLHKVSSPDGNYLVVYRVNGHFRAFNYLMEKKMMKVISRTINKNGRLSDEDCIKLVEFALLSFKDGTRSLLLLVDKRKTVYPLSKELLQRMLDLGLEVEEESTAAL
ncbi:hypothetical protein Tco_0924535 [Tanacetum coccineum]|uniref:Uncharacterized protein n=1 Tax=Tanacetum coccineum TaxID=301880 RepID=A0ABQ5D466_9ASTR